MLPLKEKHAILEARREHSSQFPETSSWIPTFNQFPHSMSQRKRRRRASSVASSSAGITGVGSTASSSQPSVDEPSDKKSKFEKRYKTATSSKEDVLRMSWHHLITMTLTRKIEKQMKSWTSSVYAHFSPPSIMEEDGEVTYDFVCKKWVMHVWIWT